MAKPTSDELKGRVIGIGAARVSGDKAQIALIEEYLRCQGRKLRGALTGDAKLKREGKTAQAVGKIKQKVEKVVDKVKDAIS